MRTFTPSQTADALSFHRLIPALRDLFVRGCAVPPRGVHQWTAATGGRVTSLVMPAWIEGEVYGVKVINMATGNTARGLPGLHASYLLFDADTGVPLACMDGDQLTLRRTAAASALAASYLCRPGAQDLLVVGAGRIAALLPFAYREVRPLRAVRVWARRADQARALAQQWAAQGVPAQAVTDLNAALGQADIVSCATLAHQPVIAGRHLKPESHLDLIGSFTPEMREADDDCFRDAEVYVDVEEALRKSGELIAPMQSGAWHAEQLRGTLEQMCRHGAPFNIPPGRRTLFKSVGTALEDLAAARLVMASN